ncbi:unnamed protein product [Sphenostylis stenocarpa]|uniref:Uncharacterized protein n=1 Tax=Sphenostylis stenocarpa TaxID=92480 RepID=A0AA86VQG1_9FABA|nr:unnamed protein product [Sphenostylis stenocarpa]
MKEGLPGVVGRAKTSLCRPCTQSDIVCSTCPKSSHMATHDKMSQRREQFTTKIDLGYR